MLVRIVVTVVACAGALALAASSVCAAQAADAAAGGGTRIVPPSPAPDPPTPVPGGTPRLHLIPDPPVCILWRAPLGDPAAPPPGDGPGPEPVNVIRGCVTPCLDQLVRWRCRPVAAV
jgi:hypothetical protein